MKKGISPIVAVVLLIAIAVIAAVGLYFWVGGLATQQPTTDKPGVISANCVGQTVMVSNIGTTTIESGQLDTACDAVHPNGCNNTALATGATCVCKTGASGSGVVYGTKTGSASYNC